MAIFDEPTYYAGGASGASSVIGWESQRNRVVRFSFITGSSGATSITISITAGTIAHQQGVAYTRIPFYITTSSTSHANANLADDFAVTGYITGSNGNAYTGTANIVLKASTRYYVWFFPPSKDYGWSYWHNSSRYTTSHTESGTSKFSLSISAGAGSSITVNRTSSSVGLGTGNLSNGAVIYKNDVLKISASPNTNYRLLTLKVNNSNFTSGNSYTVSGNVTVASTAQVLASSVGATNANIGSTSTITVTKYNSSYYHSLQYSFGNISGYIKADGTTSSSEVKFSQTGVAFTVPTTFYAQIPNAKTGTCTITCRTYSSSSSTTVLGAAKTCTFTVTASSSACTPTVTGAVVDTNATTKALTGDENALIRYKSTAMCTLTATPKHHATISTTKIDDTVVTGTVSGDVVTATKSYSSVSATSFVFETTDSRGYTSLHVETPTMIAYVNLTCNPLIYRPTPTGSEIVMTLSGDLYRGSFGAYNNSLTLQYRYKQQGGSYGSWTTISSGITYGTNSYRIASAMSLGSSFDYQKEYVFQVQAYDGANGTTLSTVTKTITVQRGIPVFDWGENDFNVNVPLNASEDITVDGNSIYIKYKDITLNSVPLTTQSSGGAYYYNTGYVPTDYNISGNIISLMVTNWSGAAASFVPYYYNNKISFISDISQTVTKIVLRVIYI